MNKLRIMSHLINQGEYQCDMLNMLNQLSKTEIYKEIMYG